nr:hypothetical protein [Marinobacter sediminum]
MDDEFLLGGAMGRDHRCPYADIVFNKPFFARQRKLAAQLN